ncbi:MAG: TolC family protein, partial [Magnetococcus sp. DMHC-8]
DSLHYRKTLLENLRQLESIQQEMGTARVELAAMMTLPPGTPFVLAIPDGALQAPVWHTPLAQMEESALLNQPDMREMAYQGRIVVDESRKSLLKLLPGLSLSASRQRDDNSYTYHNNWYEAGLRVTWNLVGLLSAPAQLAYGTTNEEVLEIKRLALRMALLSQVHVAHHQFEQAIVQLRRSDELFQVEKEIAGHVANRVANEAQSPMDRIASETSAILAELRRYHALALAHNALGRMMATTGQDPDVAPIQEGSLAQLTARVEKWLAGQTTGEIRSTFTQAPLKVEPVTSLAVDQSAIGPVSVTGDESPHPPASVSPRE